MLGDIYLGKMLRKRDEINSTLPVSWQKRVGSY